MSDDFQDFSVGRVRLTHWVAGLVLAAVLGWVGWAHVQKASLKKDLIDVERRTTEAEAQLAAMTSSQLDAVIVAKTVSDQVRSGAIQWSDVIVRLLKVTPLDVFYHSYSASVEGKMTVNATTDTYESAAQLISILTQDSSFSEVFVPSLTEGEADTGASRVSFGVTFNVL